MTRQADPAASRAVLIGVSEYAEPERWEALPATRTNVEDLRTVLTDPAAWGLPTENCAALVDPRDRLAVLEAVAEAANEARDTVFVYYTGHGATTEEDLLLTLASTTSKNLGYSAVEFAAVRRIVQGRRAAHAVIVLDCCFSGKAHAMADPVSFLDTQINAASAYTLTSSARNSISLAPPGERHTAFTGALLGVLAAGSPYAGELLTLADMTRAVSGALADRQMPTPRYSQSGPADVLALVRNRAWRPTAVPDAAPVADPRTDPALTRDAATADPVPPPTPATPPGSSRVVAGIDLGHTNATISLMLDGEAVVVENEDGRTGTPPYVAIGAAGTEVGERARRRLDRHPGQVAHLRMPAIGTPWTREVGGRRYAMHDVAGMVLAQLKRDAENACGRTVSEAAIAVPSDFTAEQCDLLRVAADGVGLTRVTFENSAVAAATAAGLL
ncbi:MAG TPA: Hsp70 family protein, partial [Micromonosporaceae bacterium]|nr:Hsp70 family protein [Micromonosporaceae bacterium]